MIECPQCGSKHVQSKGYRKKGVHRYLCMNCNRNYTVNTNKKEQELEKENKTIGEMQEELDRTGKIGEPVQIVQTEDSKEVIKMTDKKNGKKTVNVAMDREIYEWLTNLKIVPQEPYTDVLKRIKEHKVDW